MGYSKKGDATSELWAVVDNKNHILYSRGGSSSKPKLMVYASEDKAKRGLNNTWSQQILSNLNYQIKRIYSA